MQNSGGNEEAARKRFGALLRKYRGQAGLSQQELASAAIVSQSTISDLERGKKGTKREPVLRIDTAVNARGVIVDAWDAVFSGEGMTAYFREVAESEQTATKIREYSHGLVPGLYHRAPEFSRFVGEVTNAGSTPPVR
ncbi:helix-turn-helix transcriptional regulator, partial [Nocardiopsis exhalans]